MTIEDLNKCLTQDTISSIKRVIKSKFSIPCECYGVEVEDFLQDIFTIAYRRGNFDSSRSAVGTYFFWLARTEMSHIKESKQKKAFYGIQIPSNDSEDDLQLEDESILINPEKVAIHEEEYLEKLDKLSDYFDCTMASIEKLLSCEPKEVISTAKKIIKEEKMNEEEASAFMIKIKSARSTGGFSR